MMDFSFPEALEFVGVDVVVLEESEENGLKRDAILELYRFFEVSVEVVVDVSA